MKNLKFFSGKIPVGGYGLGRSPHTDWKIIFSVALLSALIGIAINTFIFVKIDKGEIFIVEGTPSNGENTFSISELRKTVDYYKSKTANYELIIHSSTTTRFSDPSL